MRLSTDKDDPGFTTWCEAYERKPRIFLNGKFEIDDVTMADEETGEIRFAPKDRCGFIMVDPMAGEVVQVMLKGVVTIVLDDDMTALRDVESRLWHVAHMKAA